MLSLLLLLACAPKDKAPGPVTTVTVVPPPAAEAAPRRGVVRAGCERVNPTCTFQALLVDFGRLEALPAHCEGRVSEGPAPAGSARVDGLARLDGPASWDIMEDLELLARGTLSTCYREALTVDSGQRGVVELEFRVEDERSCVSEVIVVASELTDAVARECISQALMGYPLPAAGSRMSLRLTFEPAPAAAAEEQEDEEP